MTGVNMPKSFKEFKQFVTDKDKGKAPVKKIADYPGPISNAPPGGGSPYAATGKGGKAAKGAKVGSDWTDKGDKKLVYKPKTDQGMSDKKGSAKIDSVKEFVDQTKGLSPAEFAGYIAKGHKDAGIVHESISNTCKVLSNSPGRTADLVRELKRNGLLKQTVAECLLHAEGFEAVAALMGDAIKGEHVCRRLTKAMNEMIGPPAHHGMHPYGPPAHHGMLNMGDDGMMGDPSGGGAQMGPPGMPQGGPGMAGPNVPGGPGMETDPLGPHSLDQSNFSDEDEDEDEQLHPGSEDDDEFGLDDEDQDGMDPSMGAEPVSGPGGGVTGPDGGPQRQSHGAGVGLHKQNMGGMDVPKPSMMARMMARESQSPAVNNFRKALRG
jgi:hypothetical protein